MAELLEHLFSARLDSLLIIAGLFFLAIGVIGKIAGKIEPGTVGRIAATSIGAVLLVIGMVVHSHEVPPPPGPDNGTPTPTPRASPRPSPDKTVRPPIPTPTPVSLRVLSVNLHVEPNQFHGPCPVRLTGFGEITVEGIGGVRYRFIRGDGSSSPEQTLSFDAPGTKRASDTWTPPGERPGQSVSTWMALEIVDPQMLRSNRAPVFIGCTMMGARSAASNQIRDFRVIQESANELVFTVSYGYNGDHGDVGISFLPLPLLRDGTAYTRVQPFGPRIRSGEGVARLRIRSVGAFSSTGVRVCMQKPEPDPSKRADGFFCTNFSYPKTWTR